MNEELIKNLEALALFMSANIIFRLAYSVKVSDFDKKELLKGILKYIVIIIGAGMFYYAGQLCPSAGIVINDEIISVPEAFNILAIALDGVYATKCFKNILKIFECYGWEVKEINPSSNDKKVVICNSKGNKEDYI